MFIWYFPQNKLIKRSKLILIMRSQWAWPLLLRGPRVHLKWDWRCWGRTVAWWLLIISYRLYVWAFVSSKRVSLVNFGFKGTYSFLSKQAIAKSLIGILFIVIGIQNFGSTFTLLFCQRNKKVPRNSFSVKRPRDLTFT